MPTSDICAQPSTSCGDGVADVLSKTETCDDRKTVDDDGCPSDCCVTPCTLMQDRPLRVKVNFASVDPEVFLTSLNLFIRYEDGVVDRAGVNDDPAVLASVTSDIFATTPRDFNYGLNLLLEDPRWSATPTAPRRREFPRLRCRRPGSAAEQLHVHGARGR